MPDPVDLRSDTVTRPTAGMREAMAGAEVGDDVIDVDPTVDRLQRRIAELLGHEAAIFVPSGTMSNQIAVRLHCQPGDELLCEAGCHIFQYEQGGFAQLSGVVARPLQGTGGLLDLEQLAGQIHVDNEHLTRTRLICLENTHNRGAGRVMPLELVVEICRWAHDHGLTTHLDGARLFNAVAATGIPADQWAAHFDTVSVCFSKGLGAPVGSALVGSSACIARARRHRKLLGGGMRQSGIIAAGALYALEHHRERMVEDHEHAQLLASAVRKSDGLKLVPDQVDSNMLILAVDASLASAPQMAALLKQRGVWTLALGDTHIRAVTHLDVSQEGARRAAEVIRDTAEQLVRGAVELPQGEPAY